MTDKFVEPRNPWCAYLPQLHRALNDPSCISSLPNAKSLDEHTEFCAYWECVYYSLDALLGWKNQAKGLAHWYRTGKPVEDSPILALLKTHWDQDEMLDYYSAWSWTQGVYILDPKGLSPSAMQASSAYPDEDWWRVFKRRGQMMRYDPFYGGSNPLHLGHSESFGTVEKTSWKSCELYGSQENKMQVVLIVQSIFSWRTELECCASTLPTVNGRSWRIKVFDKRTGFLGEFRQSRETGLWFTGRHRVHMMGN